MHKRKPKCAYSLLFTGTKFCDFYTVAKLRKKFVPTNNTAADEHKQFYTTKYNSLLAVPTQ